MGLQDGRLVLHVDTRGAAYPLHVDPFIQQGSKITAGELGAGVFGSHVALSGDGKTALVAAPNDSPRNVVRAGAVWVFVQTAEGWTQQGEPLTGAASSDAYFGTGVALSSNGSTALIGSAGGGSKEEPAYVFTRSGTTWSLHSELKGSTEKATSNFGSSVALSTEGNYAVVGASQEPETGAAYVFHLSAGKWTQQAKLTGTSPSGNPHLGETVAINEEGTIAIAGGPSDNKTKGAAWVFTSNGETWKQFGEKLASPEGETNEGRFGASVALGSGGRVALIGAPGDNGNVGAAFVYESRKPEEAFHQTFPKITAKEETGKGEFGAAVALDGEATKALISRSADNSKAGATWEFVPGPKEWTQSAAKRTAGSEESGEGQFGDSVALSKNGGSAFVGAATDNSAGAGWGAAWAYSLSGETWAQVGEKLTGTIEEGKGQFGTNTAISGDGKTALVAAFQDNGGKGAVWVFTRTGSEWNHQGNRLTGGSEEVGAAEFGVSVALSADGNTALIGGQFDYPQTGAVWVFVRSQGKWTQQSKKLVAPNPKSPGGSLFGSSVALSGNGYTTLIGVRGEEAAYFFIRSGETSEPGADVNDPEGKGSFGVTVALSADGTTAMAASFLDNEKRLRLGLRAPQRRMGQAGQAHWIWRKKGNSSRAPLRSRPTVARR